MTKFEEMVDGQKASIATQPSVHIEQIQDDQIMINGKLIYRDQNDLWIAGEELTITENREFRKFLSNINNRRGGTSSRPYLGVEK